MAVDINTQVIQAELQDLTGCKVSVKLNKHLDVASLIAQTDKGFTIVFNPKRFRSPDKLERHLDMCRTTVAGGV